MKEGPKFQTIGKSYDGNLAKYATSAILYLLNGKSFEDLVTDQLLHATKQTEDLKKRVGKLQNLFEDAGIKGLAHVLYLVLDQLFEAQAGNIVSILSKEVDGADVHVENFRKQWALAVCDMVVQMTQGVHIKTEVKVNDKSGGRV